MPNSKMLIISGLKTLNGPGYLQKEMSVIFSQLGKYIGSLVKSLFLLQELQEDMEYSQI
jgi:hypothetical protein